MYLDLVLVDSKREVHSLAHCHCTLCTCTHSTVTKQRLLYLYICTYYLGIILYQYRKAPMYSRNRYLDLAPSATSRRLSISVDSRSATTLNSTRPIAQRCLLSLRHPGSIQRPCASPSASPQPPPAARSLTRLLLPQPDRECLAVHSILCGQPPELHSERLKTRIKW